MSELRDFTATSRISWKKAESCISHQCQVMQYDVLFAVISGQVGGRSGLFKVSPDLH